MRTSQPHCWRAGYRDDSLETVKRNEQQYQVPLEVVSYKQLYGWTMDEIVREIGKRNNCTFCGVFRRQALDRGAHMVQVSGCGAGLYRWQGWALQIVWGVGQQALR